MVDLTELAHMILPIVAPILVLLLIGYVWNKQSAVPFERNFVSRLCLDIGAPCLVLSTLGKLELEESAMGSIFAAGLLAYLIIGISGLVLLLVIRRDIGTHLPLMMFGNTANLGLPICLYATGEAGFALGTIIFAISLILQNLITPLLIGGNGSWRTILRTPVVHAALIGSGLVVGGITLPLWLAQSLSLVGQLTIPLMLISLGHTLSGISLRASGPAFIWSAARLSLGAASAFAVIALMGLTGIVATILLIQMAMPAAVYNYALAERLGADSELAAQVVAISTFMALLLLPVLVVVALNL